MALRGTINFWESDPAQPQRNHFTSRGDHIIVVLADDISPGACFSRIEFYHMCMLGTIQLGEEYRTNKGRNLVVSDYIDGRGGRKVWPIHDDGTPWEPPHDTMRL